MLPLGDQPLVQLTLLWIVKPCYASLIGWWLPGT